MTATAPVIHITATPYADRNDQPNLPVPAAHPIAEPECFYGLAGEFARVACEKSEADPIGVLMHFVTWIGAYFGNKAVLRLGEVDAPARLNVVTVSTTGGGKGTAAAPVRRLMHDHLNPVLSKLNLLPIQYRDGPMSSGEGLAFAVRDESDVTDKDTGEPIDPGVTDKRLMIVEEEFAAVLQASKREGNTISAAIRRFWDSGSFSPMTKNNRVTVTNAHVCFVGHITYDELTKRMDENEYSNGFANRILWACIRRPRIVPVPERIPEDTMNDFADRLAQAVRYANLTKNVSFSTDALRLWESVAVELATQDTNLSERARGQVLRIACIFTLLDCEDQVRLEHLKAALNIWDYCTASIQYIFESAEGDNENQILDALRKHGDMTTTEVSAKVYSRNIKSKTLNSYLKSLESKGKITRFTRPPAKGKGRPSTVFSAV